MGEKLWENNFAIYLAVLFRVLPDDSLYGSLHGKTHVQFDQGTTYPGPDLVRL